ncbi:periplasmic component of amino acid ABC-type transporter/signal transduction system [Herbaspirillum sp. CF444]|uniref:ABC transporter substrate-binding protein n=1 Tax=Herbaspirillum sp. CF444 TaxID=1144319 RepID=UPI00027278B7|nr:ABC transporter substrate-binding protein [Herbaspirillum sp. CF444]EJL93490.1 periplasmic component of amino acid ABC-type transporter/signal transduction system [Herbaspirillum sp. CF444]
MNAIPNVTPATSFIRNSVVTLLRNIVLAAIVASVGVQTSTASAATAAPIITPGVLTVGADLTYPPYDYFQGDQPVGFDPAFMKRLAGHLGLTVRFLDTRFANLILGVNARRFDVIASALYVTPERAKQLDYLPYLKTGGSLMTLQDSDFKPQTPEDLCGKKISSIKGASWIPRLREVSQQYCIPGGKAAIDVREFETSPGAAQAVLAHAVDAQFEDSAVAKMTVNKMADRLRISSTEPLYPVVIGLGVVKGNKELLTILQTAFESMQKSGEYKALLNEYNVKEPSAQDISRALGNTAK